MRGPRKVAIFSSRSAHGGDAARRRCLDRLILISGLAIVTEEQIAEFRGTFETLAEKAGSENNGWEAAATP